MSSMFRTPSRVARPSGLDGCRQGFTLIEVTIALTISLLALLNMHLVSKAGTAAATSGILKASINDELDLTMDRISLALMGSSEDEITGPPRAPANSTEVEYAIVLGYEDEEAILSPTESISWSLGGDNRGVVEWRKRKSVDEPDSDGGDALPDGSLDQALVWSKSVPNAFQGEALGNAEDDNGNGLINEHGLAFTRDGPSVEIHLTVERLTDKGEVVSHKNRRRITCRN